MKVAFDARSLASPVLRGWDRYIIGLARELGRQGVEVKFFHRACQPLCEEHVRRAGCHVQPIEDFGGLYWEQVAVPLALQRGKFDIFHAPAEHGVPLATRAAVVFTFHSATFLSYKDLIRSGLLRGPLEQYVGLTPKRSYWALYAKAQLARADHILTPSEFSRDEIVRLMKVAPARVTVTPLAVDEQFHAPAKPESEIQQTLQALGVRRPYLLYVGGYEPHKNVPGLLKVFARLRPTRPDLSLVLVGSKSLPPELLAQAEVLGLRPGGDTVFLVNLGPELTDLYDAAELFVTMSWRETFCLPALEAMSRGRQVVGSSWGALAEIAGDTARLVDPRDPVAAANAIWGALRVAHDAAISTAVKCRAQSLSWRLTAEKTREVYAKVIGVGPLPSLRPMLRIRQ